MEKSNRKTKRGKGWKEIEKGRGNGSMYILP
jgi:hypothetical protein